MEVETITIDSPVLERVGYPAHRLAEMLPPMTDEERVELLKDIKEHGQLNDIVLFEDQVLDGRNRQGICLELDVPPRYIQFADLNLQMTPFDYVISQNCNRRHLTPSQKAALGAEILKARQAVPASAILRSNGKASNEVAKLTGASARSVESAVKVGQKGTESLQQALKAGDIPVSTAAEIADLPHEEQNAIVKSGSKKVAAKAAKEILAKKRAKSGRVAGKAPATKAPVMIEPESKPQTAGIDLRFLEIAAEVLSIPGKQWPAAWAAVTKAGYKGHSDPLMKAVAAARESKLHKTEQASTPTAQAVTVEIKAGESTVSPKSETVNDSDLEKMPKFPAGIIVHYNIEAHSQHDAEKMDLIFFKDLADFIKKYVQYEEIKRSGVGRVFESSRIIDHDAIGSTGLPDSSAA